MKPKLLNIYQRINEIRKSISYVQKDKEVKGQGYMAVTHDYVTALVRGHYIIQGVVVEPKLIDSRTIQDTGRATQTGVPIIRFESIWDIHFVNIDDPQDRIIVTMPAHADDAGDKAPGKAASYAVKYAELKLLKLETGEDEEGRVEAVGRVAADMARQAMDALEKGNWAALCALHTHEHFKHAWGMISTQDRGRIKDLLKKRDEYRDTFNNFTQFDEVKIREQWEELNEEERRAILMFLTDDAKTYIESIGDQEPE